jgi:hypothetical protein
MKFSFRSLLLLLTLITAPFALAKPNPEITQFGHAIVVAPRQKTSDLTCIACSIHVGGDVAGDVTTIAGDIVVEEGASVAGDVTSIGGAVRIASGTKVAGDLTALGGKISRDPSAQVAGDVTALVGPVWLALIFGLPLFLLAGIIALVVWLLQKRRPQQQTYARAA